MGKLLALDLGDVWIGTALSDPLGMFARPHKTIGAAQLTDFLQQIIAQEQIQTIIVGLPTTLGGTQSEQTKKVGATAQQLEQKFPAITFVLWDERLTSKRAEALKRPRSKEEKQQAHSVAAAFILQSYLDHQAFKRSHS